MGIRSEYYKRGFQEVVSPNIYNSKLWQTSGHWEHYSDAMFKFESEKEMFGLKPMNCPGQWLILVFYIEMNFRVPLLGSPVFDDFNKTTLTFFACPIRFKRKLLGP